MFTKKEYMISTVLYVLFACCILSPNVSATFLSIANAIAGSGGSRANYEMAPSPPPPKPTLGKMIGDKIDGISNFKAMIFGPLLNLASVLLTKGSGGEGAGSAGTSSKAPAPPSSAKGSTSINAVEKATPPPPQGGGRGAAPAYYGGGVTAPTPAYHVGGAPPPYYGSAPPPTYYGAGDGYFPSYYGGAPGVYGGGEYGHYNFDPSPSAGYMSRPGNTNSKSGVFVQSQISDKYRYDISHPSNFY